MAKPNPFRRFRTSSKIIHLAMMPHVRFPLSLRNVEDLLQKLGARIRRETVRYWWRRFGRMFAAGARTVLERSVHCEIDDIVHCLFGFPVPGFRVGFDAGAMSQHLSFGLQVAGFDVGSIEAR